MNVKENRENKETWRNKKGIVWRKYSLKISNMAEKILKPKDKTKERFKRKTKDFTKKKKWGNLLMRWREKKHWEREM